MSERKKYSKEKYVTETRKIDSTDLKVNVTYFGIKAPIYDKKIVTDAIEKIKNRSILSLETMQEYFNEFKPENIEAIPEEEQFGLGDFYEDTRNSSENYTNIDKFDVMLLTYLKSKNRFYVLTGQIYAKEGNKLYIRDKAGNVIVSPLQNNTCWYCLEGKTE